MNAFPGDEKRPVRLVGGRCHGKTIEVEPTRQIITVTAAEYEKHYGPGEFTPDGPPVTATVIEIETYKRVGPEKFVPHFDHAR